MKCASGLAGTTTSREEAPTTPGGGEKPRPQPAKKAIEIVTKQTNPFWFGNCAILPAAKRQNFPVDTFVPVRNYAAKMSAVEKKLSLARAASINRRR
jgi:hypothetical protein